MAKILNALIMGNPLLLNVSQKVEDPLSEEIQTNIEDMFATIHSFGERVGLAAPQVGILKRIIVYRVPAKPLNARYGLISNKGQEDIPWSVLINPTITPIGEEKSPGWEGCISVPGILGEVNRYNQISYSGMNEKGEEIERTASGFHARLIQHECDHLDGILFPMRVHDLSRFGFEAEILAQSGK